MTELRTHAELIEDHSRFLGEKLGREPTVAELLGFALGVEYCTVVPKEVRQ